VLKQGVALNTGRFAPDASGLLVGADDGSVVGWCRLSVLGFRVYILNPKPYVEWLSQWTSW